MIAIIVTCSEFCGQIVGMNHICNWLGAAKYDDKSWTNSDILQLNCSYEVHNAEAFSSLIAKLCLYIIAVYWIRSHAEQHVACNRDIIHIFCGFWISSHFIIIKSHQFSPPRHCKWAERILVRIGHSEKKWLQIIATSTTREKEENEKFTLAHY